MDVERERHTWKFLIIDVRSSFKFIFLTHIIIPRNTLRILYFIVLLIKVSYSFINFLYVRQIVWKGASTQKTWHSYSFSLNILFHLSINWSKCNYLKIYVCAWGEHMRISSVCDMLVQYYVYLQYFWKFLFGSRWRKYSRARAIQ